MRRKHSVDRSVWEKAEYVNRMGLGGAMLWSVETDDFRGNCGEAWPLLMQLNRVLRNWRKDADHPSERSIELLKKKTTQSFATEKPESRNDKNAEADESQQIQMIDPVHF